MLPAAALILIGTAPMVVGAVIFTVLLGFGSGLAEEAGVAGAKLMFADQAHARILRRADVPFGVVVAVFSDK